MSLHLRLGWLLQVRLPIAARRGFFLLTAWLCFRAGLGGPARPWPWDCQIFCVRAVNGLLPSRPCFYQVGLINRSPYRIAN